MFPLNANEPYIKETGERSTLGDMLEGGGSEPYTLPPATVSTLGGVKIGSGINVSEDGTISASGGSGGSSGSVQITSYTTNLMGGDANVKNVADQAPATNARLIGVVHNLAYLNMIANSNNVISSCGLCFSNFDGTTPNCFYCFVRENVSNAKFDLIWWVPSATSGE